MTGCSFTSSNDTTGVNSTKTISFTPKVMMMAGSSLQVTMPLWYSTTSNSIGSFLCSGISVRIRLNLELRFNFLDNLQSQFHLDNWNFYSWWICGIGQDVEFCGSAVDKPATEPLEPGSIRANFVSVGEFRHHNPELHWDSFNDDKSKHIYIAHAELAQHPKPEHKLSWIVDSNQCSLAVSLRRVPLSNASKT